jgi:hypothetical protein
MTKPQNVRSMKSGLHGALRDLYTRRGQCAINFAEFAA